LVVAVSLGAVSQGETSQGWGSPAIFTLRVMTGVIESATFRMFNAQGEILVEASLDSRSPAPADGSVSGNTAARTLTWPVEKGYGTRLDIGFSVRLSSGELRTSSLSIPYSQSRQ
jgi:hypothetical protein